jgi:hypothetical protein
LVRQEALLGIAIPIREPFLAYVLVHAQMLRRQRVTPEAAERLEAHAQALDLLAELVRSLPEDDERMLVLGTLACAAASSRLAQAPNTH